MKETIPPAERNQISMKDDQMSADHKIADLYMGFSAELLRLSLIGIGAIGYVLSEGIVEFDKLRSGPAQPFFVAGLVSLVLCACLALAHRYCASESMAFQLSVMRTRQLADAQTDEAKRNALIQEWATEKRCWHRRLKWSGHFMFGASMFLGIGIVLVALALTAALAR